MPLDIALELREYRISTIPLQPQSKRPIEPWRRLRYERVEPRELLNFFPHHRPDLNVGVLCGAASDRLVVLDCDNELSFQRMINALGNPETMLVRSYRGGHIYLRTIVTVRSHKIAGVEIKAEGAYVLAPGSLHPKGIRYEFLRKASCILELNSLKPIPEIAFEPAPVKPKEFPTTAWLLLTGRNVSRSYESRSERECAACASFIGHGLDFNSVLRFFTEYACPESKFAELHRADRKNAERWLRLTYDNAARFVGTNASREKLVVRELRARALSLVWVGRNGLSDRATYLAHLDIADKSGKLVYGASVRELAEFGALSIPTVSKANKRLVDDGLLKLEREHTFNLSQVWRLLPHSKRNVQVRNTLFTLPSVRECAKLVHGHDAFRWRGGKSIAIIWQVLKDADKPLCDSAIVKITGRHRHTVRRAMQRMKALGMVEWKEDGWQARGDINLDVIARMIGTLGKAENQKIRHVKERRNHYASLAR